MAKVGRRGMTASSGGKLPVGNCQIVATFAGNAEKRSVAVGAANLRTIDFRWGSE